MDIVKPLRTALWALALIVALIGVTMPAYADQGRAGCRPASANAGHDCCKTPVLRACCSDRSNTHDQGAPVQSRIQVHPNYIAAPAVFVTDLSSRLRAPAANHATAPRAGPVDLPTLLSTLLL
jgi:hypothetical protein